MREAEVQQRFVEHLEATGWSVTTNDPSHIDVIAHRETETLIAEVKGTTASAGLDSDTMFGQLLRRMGDLSGSIRYAVVVPESMRGVVERVPVEVRERLGVEVWLVPDEGEPWMPIANSERSVHRGMRPTPWTAVRSEPVPDDVARLLATVPEWFGLPDANAEYIDAARTKETWLVRNDAGVVGVTLVDRHFPHVAEIYLTVVDRRVHGTGVGTAMIQAIEADARERGVRLLEVKTLGASHPDQGYARTRHFYEKMGFLPLEETDLWGSDSPCLFMVKPLIAAVHSGSAEAQMERHAGLALT